MKHITKLVRPGEELITPCQEISDQIQKGSIEYMPALVYFVENGIIGRVIPYGQYGIHTN